MSHSQWVAWVCAVASQLLAGLMLWNVLFSTAYSLRGLGCTCPHCCHHMFCYSVSVRQLPTCAHMLFDKSICWACLHASKHWNRLLEVKNVCMHMLTLVTPKGVQAFIASGYHTSCLPNVYSLYTCCCSEQHVTGVVCCDLPSCIYMKQGNWVLE